MESHNPNTSLLPAASGPIVAMQGGYDPTASMLPASSGAITPMQGGAHDAAATMLPAAEGAIVPMKGGDVNGTELVAVSATADTTGAAIVAAAEAEAGRVVAITLKAEEEAAKQVIIKAAEEEAARVITGAAASASSSAPPIPFSSSSSAPPPPVPTLPSIVNILSYLQQIADPSVGAVAPFTVTVSNGTLPAPSSGGSELHNVVQTLGIDSVTVGTPITVAKRRVNSE